MVNHNKLKAPEVQKESTKKNGKNQKPHTPKQDTPKGQKN